MLCTFVGEKMSSARGSNRDDGMTDYERQNWEEVARNNEKMESLRLHQLRTELQPAQQKKRAKVSVQCWDISKLVYILMGCLEFLQIMCMLVHPLQTRMN